MIRREVTIVWDEVCYRVGYFENGVMKEYRDATEIDWPSMNVFLKTGILPG